MKDAPDALDFGPAIDNIYILDKQTDVLAANGKSPMIATRSFGKGRSVYLSGHKFTPENVRLLHRAIFFAAQAESQFETYLCSNVNTECAYYPGHRKLVAINNTDQPQDTQIITKGSKTLSLHLEPYSGQIVDA